MCKKEYAIFVISTNYGTDFLLFEDITLADEAINNFVRENWTSTMDEPMPDNIDKAVQMYFDRPGGLDWYRIEQMAPYQSLEEAGW